MLSVLADVAAEEYKKQKEQERVVCEYCSFSLIWSGFGDENEPNSYILRRTSRPRPLTGGIQPRTSKTGYVGTNRIYSCEILFVTPNKKHAFILWQKANPNRRTSYIWMRSSKIFVDLKFSTKINFSEKEIVFVEMTNPSTGAIFYDRCRIKKRLSDNTILIEFYPVKRCKLHNHCVVDEKLLVLLKKRK